MKPKTFNLMTGAASGLLPLSLMLMSAEAAVVIDESIDYADEAGFDGAFEFDDGGKDHFNATGLTHPALAGESGGRASFLTDRVKQSLGQTFGDADETLYMSVLIQSTSTAGESGNTDSDELYRTLELYDSSVGGAGISDGDGERVYASGFLRGDGDTGSNQFEHVVYGNSATPDLGAVNTGVNLFVMKFDFTGGGSNYTVDSWLNPDVGATDFDAESNRISGAGLQFDYFGFASFAESAESSPADFDEFRAGTSIDDIGLVPEPSSSFLLGFGAVSFLLRRKRR